MIEKLQVKGLSLRGIAGELNGVEVAIPRGKEWTAKAVKDAMERL